ncbi:hypothetical protein EI94DRAFT_367964 [Lactarius quietus]|nr:hypothetical protein EI94DRAFT_367964 [Lactarius quietus]
MQNCATSVHPYSHCCFPFLAFLPFFLNSSFFTIVKLSLPLWDRDKSQFQAGSSFTPSLASRLKSPPSSTLNVLRRLTVGGEETTLSCHGVVHFNVLNGILPRRPCVQPRILLAQGHTMLHSQSSSRTSSRPLTSRLPPWSSRLATPCSHLTFPNLLSPTFWTSHARPVLLTYLLSALNLSPAALVLSPRLAMPCSCLTFPNLLSATFCTSHA